MLDVPLWAQSHSISSYSFCFVLDRYAYASNACACCSFNVANTRTFQTVWNDVTVLGPAFDDCVDVSVNHRDRGVKRRAAGAPELQPPPRRGPSLLSKLTQCDAASAVAGSSSYNAHPFRFHEEDHAIGE
jgi:hypothetical protein